MAVLFSAVTLTAGNIEDADFCVRWSPDELYGTEMEL